ncbi:MAG: 3-isopropylmalate dehydratase small subunit [Sphingopyxis sp.]
MTPFTTLTSKVLPILEDRIDTDIIFPARFLLLMQRDEMGRYFFADQRTAPDGSELPHPANDPRYRGAEILVAGADFGCGSSREQAVWSLASFGIRCVIAESLGEIFAANCLRNGVLGITLPRPVIDALAAVEDPVTVDLEAQEIRAVGTAFPFSIPAAHRERLLNGWDDIDLILAQEGDRLDAFEAAQRNIQPWLYGAPHV